MEGGGRLKSGRGGGRGKSVKHGGGEGLKACHGRSARETKGSVNGQQALTSKPTTCVGELSATRYNPVVTQQDIA